MNDPTGFELYLITLLEIVAKWWRFFFTNLMFFIPSFWVLRKIHKQAIKDSPSSDSKPSKDESLSEPKSVDPPRKVS